VLNTCPYCHHQHATIKFANQKLRSRDMACDIYCCSECNCLYPRPRMDELDIENYLAIHESDDLRSSLDGDFNDKARTKFDEFICTLLKSHMEIAGNALDIGTFSGIFCRTLNNIGFEAYGLESIREAADFANSKGLRVFKGSFPEKVPSQLLLMKYKLISMMESIYYLVDLRKSLFLIRSMLDFGGYLLIKCHQGNSKYYNDPKITYFSRYGDYVQAIPTHNSITYCLQDSGLNVVYFQPMPRLFSISKFDQIFGKRYGSTFCKIFERIFNKWRNCFITDIKSVDRLIVLAKKEEG
jgi:hypothetical protein